MATVLFVMKYPMHRPENLKGKFDGQMAAVRALGHEAYAIGWKPEGMWLLGEGTGEFLRRNRWTGMPGYDHTKIFTDLMAAVRQVLRERNIDLLYLRYMPTFGGAVETVRLLKKQGGKLVVEFPTWPRKAENRRSLLRRPVFAYTDHVLKRIHPMVDLYAVMGEDCGGQLDGRPALNIANGFDVECVPVHVPGALRRGIHLLALASMTRSHGYDRVLRGMVEYKGSEPIHLHMVGSEGDGSLAAWKALTEQLGLRSRVTFHGPLYGDMLNEVVAFSDVGIGALGTFRLGVPGVPPIKHREYMARGIPFIYSGDDPSMPQDERFCLRVPNTEEPIDMEAIAAFAGRGKRAAEIPGLMRAYAREHMSWTPVMGRVLERVWEE